MLVAACLLLTGYVSTAQKLIIPTNTPEEWSRPYKPFRIIGNLYYVGTYDLACYLIATPRGHILINTGLDGSMPMLSSNIQELGFRLSDVKVLLATHVHFDHVGAMAEIKKITGAKLMISRYDAQVLADGGFSDHIFGGKSAQFEPVKADRLLRPNDIISLGGTDVRVLHHPGHTKGANSFLVDVKDGGRWYRVLIANMPSILEEAEFPGMQGYEHIGDDYAYTFTSLKKLQFDIWLSSHASQFGLHSKHKPGDAHNPHAFNDRAGFDAAVNKLEKEYLKRSTKK